MPIKKYPLEISIFNYKTDGICYCPKQEIEIFYNGEVTKKGKLKKIYGSLCKRCNGEIIERGKGNIKNGKTRKI